MKKVLFPIAFIMSTTIVSCDAGSSQGKAKTSETPSSPIDGAWEIVWAKYNDTIKDVSKMPMLKIFHDGVFTLIARDSSGKIDYAGFGHYELSDSNTYKETFQYHSYAPFTGAMDWQNYELKNDTLYFKGFNKVVVGGEDRTKGWLRIEEKRVRIKW